MDHYEYAILGGGASGLSLAYALLNSPLRERPLLLVEKDQKDRNDRTWSYWTVEPSPLDSIRRQVWHQLLFVSGSHTLRLDLTPFRYQMVQGLDYYRFMYAELARHPNVHVLRAAVEDVWDGERFATVIAGGQTVQAAWVFDSRFSPSSLPAPSPGTYDVKQHFRGWEIETTAPAFDPTAATLFDLRAPQPEGLSFFYVLPFSPTRALVEYTLFSCSLLPEERYDQAIQQYIEAVLGIHAYQVLETESGVIPMTNRPFSRKLGNRILSIGTRGGRVKPSTGYAFARIQRDSDDILRSLVEHGDPFHLTPTPRRYQFYDSLLLDLLARSDPRLRAAFTALFNRNPVPRLFRFLDEQSTPLEDLLTIATLPPLPFLEALLRRLFKR